MAMRLPRSARCSAAGKSLDLPAVKSDGAGADRKRLAQQADQRERRNTLAAAGFADKAECLATIDAE
jgi:hypothetical protein